VVEARSQHRLGIALVVAAVIADIIGDSRSLRQSG
jgi:hypothetical protein